MGLDFIKPPIHPKSQNGTLKTQNPYIAEFRIWMIIFNAPKAVFSCKIKVLASPCHHLARGPNG